MKDLPHHMKKLNRRIIRSSLREASEGMAETIEMPKFRESHEETRKMAKQKMKEKTLSRTPTHDTEDERNRKMRHRVPIFDRNNAKPKSSRPSKKKTPRI